MLIEQYVNLIKILVIIDIISIFILLYLQQFKKNKDIL